MVVPNVSKKVTLQSIADQLGITKVSVSKAINSQPGISDGLRRQILEKAREMGYNKPLRNGEHAHKNFAWVCPKRYFLSDEAFYTVIYYYINKLCAQHGHTLSCFVLNNQEEESGTLPTKLKSESFDGIFIAGEMRPTLLDMLTSLGGVKIAIDFYTSNPPFDCIIVDNFLAGMVVTDYLIARGHESIGFVGCIDETSSICDRYFGYLKSIRLHHLPVEESWHIPYRSTEKNETAMQIVLPDTLPTAFVCHCDKTAFLLMQRLEAAGARVPQDASIISFDNTSLAEMVIPNLTSVNIDCKQFASLSWERMFHRFGDPDAAPAKVYLGTSLVERQSVATR